MGDWDRQIYTVDESESHSVVSSSVQPHGTVHGILQARLLEWVSESEVAQSCPTPCNPMDCSPPGSSVHGIFQARVLEWVAIVFAQSCPVLCLPMDCSPWNYLRQNPGVGSRSLLQRIFPTQKSNPGLPHCRLILYQLSY